MIQRCGWAITEPSLSYHDTEWGVPVHDDRTLFEFLILESAQAGLSWEIILKKREGYRAAFDGFDPVVVAGYGSAKSEALLADTGIIRNRLKIKAAIRNAQLFLAIQQEFGSFDRYVWGFIGGVSRKNAWLTIDQLPVRTPESDLLSQDLHNRGFRFLGSTICYAFMQATGMVNDHTTDCFRYTEID